LYSSHTLDVADGVQTLSGYILNSQDVAATFYYKYGRWNDSTLQSHTITVAPGSGSTTFPTNAPQLATYSANFLQLIPYTASISPSGAGQVAVVPQPQTYAGLSGEFFVARQQVVLTATPSSGWHFYQFNNAPFWLPGGLGANPKTFDVPDTGNPVATTAEFSNTPVYTVDITPNAFSSNLYVYVDGTFFYTPKTFSETHDPSWTQGSSHTLSLDAAETPYSFNSRYNFSHWSDGGALSHSIVSLPATATKYLATVTREFQPATNFGFPPCGGSAALSPTSPTNDGFYPAGQQLSFSATPDSGWTFAGWTFDLSGITNPNTLTASG
jgi:Divergent InlB B-repeat domain